MVGVGDIVTFASSEKLPPLKVLSISYPMRSALVQSVKTGRRFGLRFERMLLLERAR